MFCSQCQEDRLGWDQPFTVSAWCEGCDLAPERTKYSWSLYLVNASSKPAAEGPRKEKPSIQLKIRITLSGEGKREPNSNFCILALQFHFVRQWISEARPPSFRLLSPPPLVHLHSPRLPAVTRPESPGLGMT